MDRKANSVPIIDTAEIDRMKALARIILDDRAERRPALREWLQLVDSVPRSARVALFQSLALHPDNQPVWDLLVQLDTAARRAVAKHFRDYRTIQDRIPKRCMSPERIETAEIYLAVLAACDNKQSRALHQLVSQPTERHKGYAQRYLADKDFERLRQYIKSLMKGYTPPDASAARQRRDGPVRP